jgi:hypothetical protein
VAEKKKICLVKVAFIYLFLLSDLKLLIQRSVLKMEQFTIVDDLLFS